MRLLLRYVLLAAIAVAAVEIVVGVVSQATGMIEKAVLLAVGLALVFAASRVRRIGAPTA